MADAPSQAVLKAERNSALARKSKPNANSQIASSIISPTTPTKSTVTLSSLCLGLRFFALLPAEAPLPLLFVLVHKSRT